MNNPTPHDDRPTTTHFGFRDVPTGDKQKLVGQVFSSLAGGTGDIALLLRDGVGDAGSIVLGDINGEMLRVGRDRTKYGVVRTDHILFIASGTFHLAKP